MSRQLPKTREEAFAYQFEDDVKILHSMAILSEESFKKHLVVLQAHIDAYNNVALQNACKEAVEKANILKQKMTNLGYTLD